MMVARPVERGTSDAGDIEYPVVSADIDTFASRFADLSAERAGIPLLLGRFRDGDETLIATERLSGAGDALAQRISRDAFFDGLRETTGLLQNAVESALSATLSRRDAIKLEVDGFRAAFGETRFTPYPVGIEGSPRNREETLAHGRAAHALTQRLAREPALARLTIDALPRFAQRMGTDPADRAEARRIDRFFAIETANLILARILLIRFLEDHGFFDLTTPDGVLTRCYLCNGGVKAFQGMSTYFGHGYTRLLEEAYRSGAKVYAAAFKRDRARLGAGHALARTVAHGRMGDVPVLALRLHHHQGRRPHGRLRPVPRPGAAQGQGASSTTPPSIARWMLDRLGLSPEDSVLDPACGSGTFIIERYQQAVGEDADRGLASYDEARAAVARIAGNDLNPFSAILTQIQLLWHLLSFGAAVHAESLPSLSIAERANTLVPTILKDQSTTRFGDIDRDDYAAVVGNPPYVRPERGLDLDPAARDYFASPREVDGVAHGGVSVDRNLYRLFIYRALDHWCANPGDGRTGKLAFVLPLGFCTGSDAAGSQTAVRARWAAGRSARSSTWS